MAEGSVFPIASALFNFTKGFTMARPRKDGLDYFPHDTNASHDEKIMALRHLCGNDGYAFYFIILEMIFRGFSGNYTELDLKNKELKKVVVKSVGISFADFDYLVKMSLDIGLFDKKLFEKRQVLTSKRVKAVYTFINKQRKRQRKPLL